MQNFPTCQKLTFQIISIYSLLETPPELKINFSCTSSCTMVQQWTFHGSSVLYCPTLYCTIQFCNVLYHNVLIFDAEYGTQCTPAKQSGHLYVQWYNIYFMCFIQLDLVNWQYIDLIHWTMEIIQLVPLSDIHCSVGKVPEQYRYHQAIFGQNNRRRKHIYFNIFCYFSQTTGCLCYHLFMFIYNNKNYIIYLTLQKSIYFNILFILLFLSNHWIVCVAI